MWSNAHQLENKFLAARYPLPASVKPQWPFPIRISQTDVDTSVERFKIQLRKSCQVLTYCHAYYAYQWGTLRNLSVWWMLFVLCLYSFNCNHYQQFEIWWVIQKLFLLYDQSNSISEYASHIWCQTSCLSFFLFSLLFSINLGNILATNQYYLPSLAYMGKKLNKNKIIFFTD